MPNQNIISNTFPQEQKINSTLHLSPWMRHLIASSSHKHHHRPRLTNNLDAKLPRAPITETCSPDYAVHIKSLSKPAM